MQQRSEDRRSAAPKTRIWFGHHSRRIVMGKLESTKRDGFMPDPYYIIPENESISQWEDVYQNNRADLSGLLLIYLFYGNDGRITWSEHRRMKKFIKMEGKRISLAMRDSLVGFLEHGFDEERLINVFREKGYSLQLFEEAFKAIKPYINQDGKYFLMTDRLKATLEAYDFV